MKKVLTIRFEIISDNEKPKSTKVALRSIFRQKDASLRGMEV